MARYPNLRSTIDFADDEVEAIEAEDTYAADEALNRKMRRLLEDTDPVSARLNEQLGRLQGRQSEDEALNAGMKRLLAQTPTRAQAAADRALSFMNKKDSLSEADLLSMSTPDKRPVHYGMDLRENPQPELAMDLRSPRQRGEDVERAISKKKDVIGEDLAAMVQPASGRMDVSTPEPEYGRDNLASKLGYQPMSSGKAERLREEAFSTPEMVAEDEWDSIYKPAPASSKAAPANADWNTPYPDKSAKPVIEDEHDVIIRRGNETWSNARGMIPGAEFAAMPPEEQAHYRKTHYLGPNGNWLKRDGEVPTAPNDPAGEVVLAGAQESKKPLVSSQGKAPASEGKREIPSALLERLRAARTADALGEGASSLGRLLTATAAQYGGLKNAPALMQDYMQKSGRKSSAFDDELAMAKAERAEMDEAEENSTTSDMALLGQNVARQLKLMPEEQIKGITGKSAKSLISILGLQNKLELEKLKQAGNTERTQMKGGYDVTKEAIRSGDRRYAVDRRFASSLRSKGLGPRATGNTEKDEKALAKFDAEVAKFIKTLPPGYGATLDNLDEIGTIIARNDGSPPGVGFWAGFVPDSLSAEVYGDDAETLRTLANNIYNEYIKGNFGTAFSAGEQARFDKAMGSIRGQVSEARFIKGLKEIHDLISRKVEQGAAGFRDEVVKTAVERKLRPLPNSEREALRGAPAPTPTPASTAKPQTAEMVMVSNGTKAFRIPVSKLAEAEKDGYRRVE